MALQQPQNQPANLPDDITEAGKTSSSAYLLAGWQPGHVMRTLHLKVVDISEPYQISFFH